MHTHGHTQDNTLKCTHRDTHAYMYTHMCICTHTHTPRALWSPKVLIHLFVVSDQQKPALNECSCIYSLNKYLLSTKHQALGRKCEVDRASCLLGAQGPKLGLGQHTTCRHRSHIHGGKRKELQETELCKPECHFIKMTQADLQSRVSLASILFL